MAGYTNLVQVLLAGVPGPLLSTKLSPVVKGSSAARDPGVVVEARAATEDLAASVGLLNARVLGAVDHASLERPVILGASKGKSSGGSGDGVDGGRVVDSGLDDEDGNIGVFGKAAGDDASCGATWEVVRSCCGYWCVIGAYRRRR